MTSGHLTRSIRVLFVCAGNICRSPMAEALFRHHAAARPELADVTVASAGVIAMPGNQATREAIAVMREGYGLDLSSHRARTVDGESADLLLALDRWVLLNVDESGRTGRLYLLGDFAGSEGEEVDDPYQGPIGDYRLAAAQIDRLVRAVVERLAREMTPPRAAHGRAPRRARPRRRGASARAAARGR
jgi:protein-tyrosine phosphatase